MTVKTVAVVSRGFSAAGWRDRRGLAWVQPDGGRDIDGHVRLLNLGLPNDFALVLLQWDGGGHGDERARSEDSLGQHLDSVVRLLFFESAIRYRCPGLERMSGVDRLAMSNLHCLADVVTGKTRMLF